MSLTEDARLDIVRGAWLTSGEADVWDHFAAIPFDEDVNPHDVVAVFGAAGGGIAAYLRNHVTVTNLILVEHERAKRRLLEMSYNGARGVTIINRDPVEAMAEVLNLYRPSVAVLNLGGRESELEVIRVLAQPNESLELLCVVFAPGERADAVDEMLRTWHDGDLRWSPRKHGGPIDIAVYCR